MAKIQEEILESYFQKLDDAAAVDQHIIDGLRKLLCSDNKPKADDVAAVFSADATASDDK